MTSNLHDSPRLLCYGAECSRSGPTGPGQSCTKSKVGAFAHTVRQFGQLDTVVVWHVHMLKLAFLVRAQRVVVFLHGIECWRELDHSTESLLRRVSMFLSNSAYTWQRFVELRPHLQQAPHTIVPLGEGTSTNDTSVEETEPAALIVGRMSKGEDYKGHRELIEAWPTVRQSIPDAELWIAGGGDLKSELEELAGRRGAAQSVKFLGVVPEETKQRLMQRCRCLAMPSTGEGFGLVYLEAMRIGRPCLTSTGGAGVEVVNPPEAGLAVDRKDHAGLVAALVQMLALNERWTRWSIQAKARYESAYTAAAFQQRLVEALAACCSS